MKLAIVILLLWVLPSLAQTRITFSWDYPTNELSTNLTFKLYGTSNVGWPMTNWPVLTNVVGTNTTLTMLMQPQRHFFVLTASNLWGESEFSNVADTPYPVRTNLGLKIRKG